MRLLVDARSLTDRRSGGVARVAGRLVAAYAETFPEDELVLATTGSEALPLPAAFDRPNVRRIHLAVPNKVWSFISMAGTTSFTKEMERKAGKTDATFLPNIGFVGQLQKPTTLLLHDLSFLIEPRWFGWKQRVWHYAVGAKRLIRSADRLLAVSERTKEDAIRLLRIPEDRIAVIPIGPTLPPHLPAPSYRLPPHPYALALGWDDPRKNARMLADVARAVGIDLIVVGRDVTRPTDSELAFLYANASVFLYPSWYEGYGLPLWEAARFGTPCIASTSGALPETAPPGTLFVNPAKPHHWVEALKLAIGTPREPKTAQSSGWSDAARILRNTLHF